MGPPIEPPLFHGIFSRARRRAAPRPARGDPNVTLKSLSLTTIVRSVDEATIDSSLEEVQQLIEALASFPPVALEWIMPLVNGWVVAAARDAGLQPHEAKHRGCGIAAADGCGMSGEALLRHIAHSGLLDRAIRRDELGFRQHRQLCASAANAGAAPPAPSPATAAWGLIELFGEWGTWLNASEQPSLPRSSLLFAHERDARCPERGTPVFEPNLDSFEKNFDVFTRGMLAGLDWTGLVAAGGAVTACALRSRATVLAEATVFGEDAIEDARYRWFEPAQHELVCRTPTRARAATQPPCTRCAEANEPCCRS